MWYHVLLLIGLSNGMLLGASAKADELSLDSEFDKLLGLSLEELSNVEVSISSRLMNKENPTISSYESNYLDWQQHGYKTPLDAVVNIPNILYIRGLGDTPAFAVRGFASQSSDRGFSTLLDGVPVNTYTYGSGSAGFPEPEMGVLDNLQVIVGSSSALHGTAAFHGAISRQTFRSREQQADVYVSASSENFQQANLRFSTALTDELHLNFAMGSSKQNKEKEEYNYKRVTLQGPVPVFSDETSARRFKYRSTSVMAKLLWNSGELMVLTDSQDPHESLGSGTAYSKGISLQMSKDTSENKTEFSMVNFKQSWQLESQGQINWQSFVWQGEKDLVADVTDINPLISAVVKLSPYKLLSESKEKRSGVEISWNNEIGNTAYFLALSHHRLDIGDYSSDSRVPAGSVIPAQEGNVYLTFDGFERDITSLVLEAQTDINNITLYYGGRIDHYYDFSTQKTPQISVSYNFSDDNFAFIKYSTGYAEPVLNTSKSVSSGERIESYELGWDLISAQHHYHATGFYNIWTGGFSIGALSPSSNVSTLYKNTDTSHAYGAELEYEYSFQQGEIFTNLSFAQAENETTDNKYEAFPSYMLNLGAKYQFDDPSWLLVASNKWSYGARASNESIAVPQHKKLPLYSRLDLTVNKTFGKHFITRLTVKNLFDRENTLPSLYGSEDGMPSTPFSLLLGVEYVY